MTDDRELRQRFAEMRTADKAAAPPLSRVLAGARARTGRSARVWAWRAVLAGAAAVLLVVAGARLAGLPPELPSVDDLALEWTSPTEPLLDGQDLVSLEIPNTDDDLAEFDSPTAGLLSLDAETEWRPR